MSEPTPTTEDAPADERKGRGPESPHVTYARLVEDVEALGDGAAEFLGFVRDETKPAELRESIKTRRAAHRERVRAEEARFELAERWAALLARAEKLSPRLRRSLVFAFSEETESAPVTADEQATS